MSVEKRRAAATRTRPPAPTVYAAFGGALKSWLLRADRSQQELAHTLQVHPSTVTTWVLGQKRPDLKSLVRLLAHFRGWLRADWHPLEALDAIACLGHDWFSIHEAAERCFQKGGILKPLSGGGKGPGRRHGAASCHPAR